jgi:hypothetical protein
VTAVGPRQPAPGAQPEPGKQRQDAATAEPQHRDGRPPTFVIEIWASLQLREQSPGRALSLSEALGRQPAARMDREPDPEPEIEP